MIKAVLFDLGGTLLHYNGADEKTLYIQGLAALHKELLRRGYKAPNFETLHKRVYRAIKMRAVLRFFSERELLSCLAPDAAVRPPVAADVTAEPTATVASGNNDLLSVAERDHITRVLHDTKGNKKAAAQLLGVSRRALYRKLDRLGVR